MSAKAIGEEVGITYHTPGEVAAGDALQTSTGRTYLVASARRIRSGRSKYLWALRCVVAEKAPDNVTIHALTWWSRGISRGRPKKRTP